MTTTWLVVNVALIAAVAAVVAIPAVVIPLRLSREHTPVLRVTPEQRAAVRGRWARDGQLRVAA